MKKILLLLALTLALCACDHADDTTRLKVSVTIEPLRWFTEQIGDTLVDVQSIVPAGSSPETYEPTPRQMVELAHSTLYIKVGQLGFETTWLDKLTASAPQLQVADASENIAYIESSDRIPDPHTWTSCANAKAMARTICQALARQDASHKSVYERNLQELLTRIDSLDAAIATLLRGSRQKTFVIYHPALTYFARDYHLHQLPLEEEGREPNAASLRHLIEQARTEHVQTIFVQQEFSPRNTIAIREATGATPVDINPLSYDWPGQMLHIARSLR